MVFVASYVADGPTVHVQTCAGWIDAAEERLHECLNQDTQSKSSRSNQAHDRGGLGEIVWKRGLTLWTSGDHDDNIGRK